MSHLYDAILESDQTASSPEDLPGALEAALSKRGLAIIPIGDPPPWMESVSNSYCDCPEANGVNSDCYRCDVEHWRIATPSDSPSKEEEA